MIRVQWVVLSAPLGLITIQPQTLDSREVFRHPRECGDPVTEVDHSLGSRFRGNDGETCGNDSEMCGNDVSVDVQAGALELPEGTRLADALTLLAAQQGWDHAWLAEQWQHRAIAVFGQRGEPDDILMDGDRIECLPPLLIDPKERRRREASAKLS